MPVGAQGVPMFRLCPKFAFCAVPEKVIDPRFSAPIAFDALPTTAPAFCAPTPVESHPMRATISVAPAMRVLAMPDLLNDDTTDGLYARRPDYSALHIHGTPETLRHRGEIGASRCLSSTCCEGI